MRVKQKLNLAPTLTPVSLAEVKGFLKIDVTDDDVLLQLLIEAAVKKFEDELDLKIMAQKWDVYLDNFPLKRNMSADNYEHGDTGHVGSLFSTCNYIELPFGNLTAVDSFITYDEEDTAIVFDASNYEVDTVGRPAKVALRRSAQWPATILRSLNGIKILCSVGYATAAEVPAYLKQAILIYIGQLYETRGDEANEENKAIPKAALALINLQRVYKL